MKSLKISLLLAIFCLTLMGLTYSSDAQQTEDKNVQTFDIEDSEYQIVSSGQIKKAKPPQS
ncbi:MAG: hypothetical protein KJO41_09160 [Bacteroidia bacterium]|nr:hypothetical protein [Bacteroidia bacterium]NND25536.1 hypothetical protein [Flavobacteriaceae bacterium]MBT8279159.1 hypothetical protein [Bacteroidia bacterium]NNK60847.1 hypothetical protein [Flavobacteriaceae bacterium]NNL33862.1 hypothetical protein [Flavobacteriaceae bacterium]